MHCLICCFDKAFYVSHCKISEERYTDYFVLFHNIKIQNWSTNPTLSFKAAYLFFFIVIQLTYIVTSLFKATTWISQILISPLLTSVSSNAWTSFSFSNFNHPVLCRRICYIDFWNAFCPHTKVYINVVTNISKMVQIFPISQQTSSDGLLLDFFYNSSYTELISALVWTGFPIRELILRSGMWKYWRSNSSSSQPLWKRGRSRPILVKTKAGWGNPGGAKPADTASGNMECVDGFINEVIR